LAAADHERERQLFRESLSSSSFVGEVGLDFSQEGKATKIEQVKSFRFVAELLATHRKLASLHSRRAESAVLETLSEFSSPPAIFHWYSGPVGVLDQALARGDYFSVNPAMTRSENGRKIIGRIPPERLLTETDGPYVRVGSEAAKPWDVRHVEDFLAGLWSIPHVDIRTRIWNNFQDLLKGVGLK
jgi:TatD DNase family protein